MEARVIITTYPMGEGDLKEFVRGILERRLAACISSYKVKSNYWWKGKMEEGEEILLIMKTIPTKVDELREYIAKNHPYEVPEILVLKADALGQYGEWLLKETISP